VSNTVVGKPHLERQGTPAPGGTQPKKTQIPQSLLQKSLLALFGRFPFSRLARSSPSSWHRNTLFRILLRQMEGERLASRSE
jgi:hypothetical protein